MLLVGLTGGIASGKSTVASLLAQHGAVVIDADRIAREIIEPGGPAHDAVLAAFGREILRSDGRIDRERLAAIVFEDSQKRLLLERITHPVVMARIADQISPLRGTDAVVVCDIPLLTETGAGREMFEAIVVVEAAERTRIERLAAARGYTEEQALARIGAQASSEQRRAIADHVIVNDGDLEALRARVGEVWSALARARHA